MDYGDLIPEQVSQLNLFVQPQQLEKRSKLDRTADQIRKKFGLKSAVKLSSLAPGGTAIERAGLVGGHNGGNSYE